MINKLQNIILYLNVIRTTVIEKKNYLNVIFVFFEGWSKSKRIRLQRPHTLDDCQHVWKNVHGELPIRYGCSTPPDRHKW